VARNGRSNVLFLPSNPGTVGSMGEEIRSAMLQAHAAEDAADGAAVADANQQRATQQRAAQRRAEQQQAQQRSEKEQRERQHRAQQQSSPTSPIPPWAQPGN
jgi:hypothetical protein